MNIMLEYVEVENIEILGALDFVKHVSNYFKIAVASNGMRINVVKSLEVIGVKNYFTDKYVFTRQDVENPKPAPDLFLFAAEKMGVSPEKCLVIEDSPTGVKGGVAAGMDVYGFTGVSNDKEKQEKALKEAGAMAIFDDFIHIREALGY